jgi:glycosyltransferase involved in cell wall biosynthesis
MKVLIAHPTGNQNVRAAVSAFADAGIADIFYTTIATFRGDLVDYLSDMPAFSILKRRHFDLRIKHITETWPWFELGRLLAMKAYLHNLTRHEYGPLSIDAVYRNLDHHVCGKLRASTRRGTTAVYAYEDGALFSFRQAKRLGVQCFYDLPIGYWRAGQSILEAEKERWPEWVTTLTGLKNSEGKLACKDEEIRLADRIYVASQFTARTLSQFPGQLPPVEVVPYGFPPVSNRRNYRGQHAQGRLKVLFVGGLTQRKGIANVFAAANLLKGFVDLTVVGKKPHDKCAALNHELSKHHWIPGLPHNEILQLMRTHDVLLFPSLFEGFGLVISEAMSQGMPVITTDRTAGPDFIEHGNNGWIVDAGSTQAIVTTLEEILLRPAIVSEAGRAALETARLRPWELYGRDLARSVQKEVPQETY